MAITFKNDRRKFLRNAILSLPAAPFITHNPLSWSAEPQAARASVTGSSPYCPLFFNKHEWVFIQAACDRLIPQDEFGPGALQTEVPVFIDRQLAGFFGHAAGWYMQGPFHPEASADRGYQLPLTPQQLYRLGIAETNQCCQQHYQHDFAALSHPQQENVLTELQHGHLTSAQLPLSVFFTFLLNNTKEGFFADPIHGGNKAMQSWRMLGYPGARAAWLEWVDKYNQPYPEGPISIQGEKISWRE